MVELDEAAGSVSNCGKLAKTKIGWASVGKVIAEPIVKLAKRPVARNVCGELRVACLNKDKLGEQGEGNCRRYRETCRSR